MSQVQPSESSWDKQAVPGHSSERKPVAELHVRVEQMEGFEFRIRFDKEQWEELVVDEPPPLGKDNGPNATRILAASIGNCLSASLLFCLTRANVEVSSVDADLYIDVARNERHRLRIPRIRVTLYPTVPAITDELAKCIEEFQDYCVVTESVREGVEVLVDVEPMTEGLEGPTS
ncbi:putative redox protein, regulator of disulfide bond formation [Labilithrix luteola]|uniref:Putative redox protein, regulator of disulfide bond formation n=1 Tax=Labilithrix luteola TaxID=1391654 RepID=A0A0K1PZV1_9BACT|nr:OsmC family protein [Labilithrix luteola]AKU98911.1 putative redox protein, regulator of disulfide bond formation [Labilithrix luteola]